MNCSEHIVEFLADHGTTDIFMVSGGGIMYLTDAVGRHPRVKHWCNYHEQASAIAAEAYARLTGRPGVCLVTVGPGATNALAGIAGAWVDSVPLIVISGQVRRELIADHKRWRQVGPQEADIIALARPITKLSIEIMSAEDVDGALDAAWEAATTGRPGPVWLSVPLDIQGADRPERQHNPRPIHHERERARDLDALPAIAARIDSARRPVVVAGNGIHLGKAEKAFEEFIRSHQLPVVTTIGGMDLLGEEHPCFVGRFGPTGQRRANFAVQNADLLLGLATGMSVAAIGFDSEGFAPRAAKVLVNIDAGEMSRPHLHPDLALEMDVTEFMTGIAEYLDPDAAQQREGWLQHCQSWKREFPILTSDYCRDSQHANTYYLAHALSQLMTADDTVVTGNSLDATSIFHSFAVKPGQRVITNTNYGSMGWDLPAAVGAAVARLGRRVVLVAGDGSLQFNVQELLAIKRHRLNVVIFILNNEGYESIRSTQDRFFDGRHVGADERSGITNPSYPDLAKAYDLEYRFLGSNSEIDSGLQSILTTDGPTLVEVKRRL